MAYSRIVTKDGMESKEMSNLILFVNSFLSYLLVFVVVVSLIVIAVKIGIALRKKKDLQMAAEVSMEKPNQV